VRAGALSLAGIAVVASGWYVIGIRQAHDTSQASAIVSGGAPLNARQAAHASSLLDAAKFLNPDRQVDVLRAQLDRDQGNLRGARAILEHVVAREPDNAVAWVWLARSSAGAPRVFIRALLQLERIVRLPPPSRAARPPARSRPA
jgi:hypothetical protein